MGQKGSQDSEDKPRAVVTGSDSNPFGGIAEADVRKFVTSYVGEDPELAAPEFNIALEAVAKAIAFRIDNPESGNDEKKLAFFLISDRPRIIAEKVGAELEPIIDNGSQCLCGSLWVTGASCSSGFAANLLGKTNGDLFKEVLAKGVGNDAVIVFDPSSTEMELRFYPRGISNPDLVRRFFFREMTFSIAKLDAVMKRLHEECLRTPDAAKGLDLWENAKKYYPIEKTEERLQGLLRLTLSIAFNEKLFSVGWEVPGTEGRCDLLLMSRELNQVGRLTHHAVLELKVLRSFSFQGSVVAKKVSTDAVKKGLGQARSYKKTNNAIHGLLCCFDMRTPADSDGEKCFDAIRASATRDKIELRNYRLFGSPEDLRTA